MLLLPVSHEDRTVRRIPWVSFGTLAICVLMQIHSCATVPDLEARALELQLQMAELKTEIIRLEVRKRAERQGRDPDEVAPTTTGRGVGGDERNAFSFFPGVDPYGGARKRLGDMQAFEQAEREFEAGTLVPEDAPMMARYRSLQEESTALEARHFYIRFGYRPALDGLASIVSSMFAHGGWLHLLGNMWFLYLVGCNLEDRWGRWQYGSFYLIGGMIAALTFTALHPEAEFPLVGASGAVAAAMGAFMVCFARVKVKIFYVYAMFFMPRYGTFQASAWLVLLFWVGEQALMTYLEVQGAGVGVAFSAHLGGFVFGASVAAMLRLSGVDAQLDDAAELASTEGEEVFSEHPLYLQAMERRDAGDDHGAKQRLVSLLAEQPEHRGAREALFQIGIRHLDMDALDYSVRFLIDDYGRRQADEPLSALYRQLREAMPSYGLTDQELLRVAAAAKRERDPERAIAAVREIMEQFPNSESMPRALWAAAEVQAHYGSPQQHKDTLLRILRRFPNHACGAMAQRELDALGGA